MTSLEKHFQGFTLIELMVLIAILGIMAAIIIPVVIGSDQKKRETAALQEIQTIRTAQAQYLSQFQRYAATMAELGPPAEAGEGPNAAGLISSELAKGEKGGYRFTLSVSGEGYTIVAVPAYPDAGRRTFYSDHTGVVRSNWNDEP